MSRRPDFIRESMWRLLDDQERTGIHDLVIGADSSGTRLEKALADVEMHRGLARKFAEQARMLLETMRDRTDSHGSPPSVVRRVEKLVDDLQATARGADDREAAPTLTPAGRSPSAYTPPPIGPDDSLDDTDDYADVDPEEEDDDELRVPTMVGAHRRPRPKAAPLETYDGEIEEL